MSKEKQVLRISIMVGGVVANELLVTLPSWGMAKWQNAKICSVYTATSNYFHKFWAFNLSADLPKQCTYGLAIHFASFNWKLLVHLCNS